MREGEEKERGNEGSSIGGRGEGERGEGRSIGGD